MKKIVSGCVVLCVFSVAGYTQEMSARDYKLEAAAALEAKDYAKGLEAFENAIFLYEDAGELDTSLYFNAGVCAYRVDDFEKAMEYFTTSIQMDYRICNALLYKANSLNKLERFEEMEDICNQGIAACSGASSKFNTILFNYYRKQGLEIYNNAARIQAAGASYIESDKARYDSEMEKARAEFEQALVWLNKAKKIDDSNDNVNKAIQGAQKVLQEMQ